MGVILSFYYEVIKLVVVQRWEVVTFTGLDVGCLFEGPFYSTVEVPRIVFKWSVCGL